MILEDHASCIIDEVAKLMDKGFACYLETGIPKYPGCGPLRCMTYQPDIYALRNNEIVLVEVGVLSQKSKIQDLRKLSPLSKIVHVRQWSKNTSLGMRLK
jgi:hypothetical protein